MDKLYRKLSLETGKLTTRLYSTSFSAGLLCMDKESREAIYSVYGFLRQADEIVDTFHQYDKAALLNEFREEYHRCRERGISLNLIINGFALIVERYSIPEELVESFFQSMESDLHQMEYSEEGIKKYIYGSADVVGLMCLRIMTRDNPELYDRLKDNATSLSSAFQKINFLRDIRSDTQNLSRNYLPLLNDRQFDDSAKREILEDIQKEFSHALEGIRRLPRRSRTGLYLAYRFYIALTRKIARTPASGLERERVRISNTHKLIILATTWIRGKAGKTFIK
jgi:phytoene/squalene synthetase